MNRFISAIAPLVLLHPALTCLAQTPSTAPTPTETFSKVINPTFAEEYQERTIQTTVKFMAAGPTEGYLWGAIPESAMDGKVSFRVLAPEAKPSTGFGNVPPHVFIAKDKSNLVFQLKEGESIILTGRTVVGKKYGMTQVVFAADSVARPPVKPAKKLNRKK
jgi:cytochrome c1